MVETHKTTEHWTVVCGFVCELVVWEGVVGKCVSVVCKIKGQKVGCRCILLRTIAMYWSAKQSKAK